MYFEIINEIHGIETIAIGRNINFIIQKVWNWEMEEVKMCSRDNIGKWENCKRRIA